MRPHFLAVDKDINTKILGIFFSLVSKEENGALKCKQCGLKFKGGVSRIKARVDGIQRTGFDLDVLKEIPLLTDHVKWYKAEKPHVLRKMLRCGIFWRMIKSSSLA
ncbi:hypothetical protein JHK82_022462 [Glycine max]|nr:hypothetical protein JHK85_022951 [Glycine max]KAG5137731.1 hypothetical protein JHK82_022462 [Glycine max]